MTENTISREWFLWALDTALDAAIKQQGGSDAGMAVAWIARQEFSQLLGPATEYQPIDEPAP